MFYVIRSEYVGSNTVDSTGAIIGDSVEMMITTQIGQKNLSREDCSEGWLGTTNDISLNACGEFKTLEEAVSHVNDKGFTVEKESESDDKNVISTWISESANRDKWDAGSYYIDGLGTEETIKEFGLTADSTFEEISSMAEKAECEARNENIELFGTLEMLENLRDELKE